MNPLTLLGSMGWSTSAHSLIQATIATLTGTSPLFAAFHPATLVVGSLIGLAFASKGIRKKENDTLPSTKVLITYCVVVTEESYDYYRR